MGELEFVVRTLPRFVTYCDFGSIQERLIQWGEPTSTSSGTDSISDNRGTCSRRLIGDTRPVRIGSTSAFIPVVRLDSVHDDILGSIALTEAHMIDDYCVNRTARDSPLTRFGNS